MKSYHYIIISAGSIDGYIIMAIGSDQTLHLQPSPYSTGLPRFIKGGRRNERKRTNRTTAGANESNLLIFAVEKIRKKVLHPVRTMAEVVPTGSVHELTSSEYFVAVLLPRGFRYFEEAMNPVVKTKMKEAFPEKPEHIQARVEFRKTFEERLKHYREVVQPKAAEARDAEEIMGSVKRGDTNERFEACMLAIKARNPTLTDKKAEKLAKKEILKPVDDFHKLRKEHHFKSPDVKESRPKLECFMDDLNDHGDLYSIVLNKTYAWIDEQHIEGLHEAVAWERDQIRGWYDKNEKALPPWIQAVHSGLSGRMKPHSHDDGNSFDTFVLSVIIRNHMESVFEQWLLNWSAFVAQNLLSELAQAEKLRNHVAHDLGEPVFVLDIMNVLRCMHRITDALCGPTVAEGLRRVLEDGQELLKQQGHPVKIQISANEFEVVLFDIALRKFEVCLTQGVDDGWMYKDGNIVLPGVQEWDSTLREGVQRWKKKLKSIATARHWLRHNTSKTPDLLIIFFCPLLCSVVTIVEFARLTPLTRGQK